MIVNKNKTIHILDRLGAMTLTRDTDLLEAGLLKTLQEILGLSRVTLLKSVQLDGHCLQSQYCPENEGVRVHDMSLAEGMLAALAQIEESRNPAELPGDAGTITLFPTMGADHRACYLMTTSGGSLPPQDQRLIQGVLQIYRNYYFLLEESQTDKLTGLLNRKTFDDSFEKIFTAFSSAEGRPSHIQRRRHQDDKSPSFWLAVSDIDHFKRINDNFGHIYGDEVLLTLSQIMQRSFRKDDLLFRFGGEEFVIIMMTDNQECPRTILERFRQNVEEHNFPQVGTVTVSIGAAQMHAQSFPSNLFGQADQALYYAKSHGRNRVFFFEDLVAQGRISNEGPKEGDIELF